MSTITLDVVTPEKIVLSREVEFVRVPTDAGEIGILPRHTELATTVKAGVIKLRIPEGEDYMYVSEGFLQVNPERITLLVDAAELAESIDVERAEHAKERAELRLKDRRENVDLLRAEAAMKRALYRLEAAELSQKAGSVIERASRQSDK